jgi:anti-anti-sigma factor
VESAFPADVVDLQVDEHGSGARVVTVTGEVDTLTAPEVAACLTAQLADVQVLVVDLDGVRFLASAGLNMLVEANELATQDGRDLTVSVQLLDRQSGTRDDRTAEAPHLRRHCARGPDQLGLRDAPSNGGRF